jgi:hypothetical protein
MVGIDDNDLIDIIGNDKSKRTGKEINVDCKRLGNDSVTCKIGTSFNKFEPDTIYIQMSFWIDLKEKESNDIKYSFYNHDLDLSKKLTKYLRRIYREDLKDILTNNVLFPYYLENIYVFDFPENINYNDKRSFVSIELNLHTLNSLKNANSKLSLNDKKDVILYSEALKVCEKMIKSDLIQGKLDFTIHKRKKD